MNQYKRVLIVDDCVEHQELFAYVYQGHQVVHAMTYEQAVRALEQNERFDQVLLDNNLGAGAAHSGETLTRVIALMVPERRPVRVVVHAGDPVAAERMLGFLNSAGVKTSRLTL